MVKDVVESIALLFFSEAEQGEREKEKKEREKKREKETRKARVCNGLGMDERMDMEV